MPEYGRSTDPAVRAVVLDALTREAERVQLWRTETRIMKHHKALMLIAALIAVGAAPASIHAQVTGGPWPGYSSPAHEDACTRAHGILVLNEMGDREWALQVIGACGPLGADALAHLLRTHRAAITQNDELERVVSLTHDLVAQALYDAALEIAMDATAGDVARVQSIRVLYFQINPGKLDPYEAFTPGPEAGKFYMPVSIHWMVATPLVSDAAQRLEASMQMLLADANTQEPIRTAANKLLASAKAVQICGAGVSLTDCESRLR